MFGPLKKTPKNPAASGGKALDFNKIKTAPANNGIVATSVAQSGNIGSMGLSKEEQVALIEKRNQIPPHIKALKYGSMALFTITLGSFLFLSADLKPDNSYFGILGLSDNTGSAFARISQENTQKNIELKKIQNTTKKIKDRITNQIFGDFVDTTDEIKSNRKTWFTEKKEVISFNEETQEEEVKEEVVLGYLDMLNYLTAYFEDRNFKTSYFKSKDEGLIASSGRGRSRGTSSDSLLMSNEVDIKSFAINEGSANLSLDVSDIYGKIFTLGGEFVEITNSTPIFKNGVLRSFQRQNLSSGDAGMSLSLRLELQQEGEEDPADQKFKYLEDWLQGQRILPKS